MMPSGLYLNIVPREKANSDDRVTVDEEVSNSDDIQESEENHSHEQQLATTTNNSGTAYS